MKGHEASLNIHLYPEWLDNKVTNKRASKIIIQFKGHIMKTPSKVLCYMVLVSDESGTEEAYCVLNSKIQ